MLYGINAGSNELTGKNHHVRCLPVSLCSLSVALHDVATLYRTYAGSANSEGTTAMLDAYLPFLAHATPQLPRSSMRARSHDLRDPCRIEQTRREQPPCSMLTCASPAHATPQLPLSSMRIQHTRTLRGWSKLWARGASRGHSRTRTCAPHGTAPLSEALGRSRIQHYSVADRAPIVIGLIAYAEF